MNKDSDLILGVLGGTWVGPAEYPGIETYVESIRRSGFTGRKVMLNWNIRADVRSRLIEYGFELVNLPAPLDPFFHARMRVCAEYMKEHHKEFRFCLFLDIKDLILQNDPSVWLEENIGNYSIIGASEPVPIFAEETNILWARNILGEKKAEEIKNNLVLNGGVIVGKAEAMAEVFQQVHLLCYPYGGPYPPCQISANYVLYTMFNKDLYIPRWSAGWAACLHPCHSPWRTPCWPYMQDPHPVLDINTCTLHAGTTPNPENSMVVFNPHWGSNRRVKIEGPPSHPLQGVEIVVKPEGKAFSVCHGLDRDWDVKALFDFRYRFGGAFNLAAFKAWNANQPLPQRGLRSIKREKLVGASLVSQPGRVFKRH